MVNTVQSTCSQLTLFTQWFLITAVLKSDVGGGVGGCIFLGADAGGGGGGS